MKLIGVDQQQRRHPLYDASGTVAAGGTAQLVLAQSQSRSYLKLQNLSAGPLWFEFGSARATCAISSGAVTSGGFTITNAGFNFTKPPVIRFLGGGNAANGSFLGLNQPNGAAPSHPALARATLSGTAVNAIVLDDPGAGYVVAPYVFMFNSDLDPYGCAVPAANSGLLLTAQSAPLILNGTCCTTDAIAVFGATTGQQFLCKWMD